MITHAISNHFGGAWDIIKLHRKLGREAPIIYKKLDNNSYEQEVFKRFPELPHFTVNTTHGDKFEIDGHHHL